ncbi:type VII secretion integral membrane protein EccD [Mycolicibacterium sp. CBMA 226]|uniref:type VII secretion integral membrane protein EccD n=1 Tax=Mycolicibacterium sp. CBMA 226 TaxID=2606611 RepID=UPI0012DE8695|nr:type VII secretion integral membrane protein EccD [Mycolicibacterium sp. CBMA 226]QGW61160.1 hypothetical protein ICEMyc226_00128 [Mycolicibacterium sp.]
MTGTEQRNRFGRPSSESPAPALVRVSVLGGDDGAGTQLDVSLPADAPVAVVVPELVALIRSRGGTRSGPPQDPIIGEARHSYWVLGRSDGTPLQPDDTLRVSGIGDGDLLRLTARRALTAPVLTDDVVDAAARLNKASFAAWSPAAARAMAVGGVYAATLVWVFLLVHSGFRGERAIFTVVAAVVAGSLVGGAALAHRSYGDRMAGAALGWAAIPILAAVGWAQLSRFGSYGIAALCAAMLPLLYLAYRLIGTGHGGFLLASVFCGLSGPAVLAHALEVPTTVAGTVLAVAAAAACPAVPGLTERLGRRRTTETKIETSTSSWNLGDPFASATPSDEAGQAPSTDEVWAKVQARRLTRAAWYGGLAAATATAAALVVHGHTPPTWSTLTFATACAVVLALAMRRPHTAVERASLAIPAGILLVATAAYAQQGSVVMSSVAQGALLATAIGAAVIGTTTGPRTSRLTAVLPYLEYVTTAALIPLALWVIGAYARLGFE